MTNKEAADELKCYHYKDGSVPEEIILAIKALEGRPKGHWIDDKCSVCGKGIEDLIDSREWYRNEIPNYCPFCGVKIEEAEDGTSI